MQIETALRDDASVSFFKKGFLASIIDTHDDGEDDSDASPTSIVPLGAMTVAHSATKDEMLTMTRFKSKVDMGETGAEVTLDYSDLHDSLSNLRLLSMHSILDETGSPARSRSYSYQTPTKDAPLLPAITDGDLTSNNVDSSFVICTTEDSPPVSTLSLCGGCRLLPSDCVSKTEESSVAATRWKIARFLGSPTDADDWFQGWQVWSYFHMKDPRREAAVVDDPVSKESVQRILLNRALDVSTRRERLATLRRDLCPFQTDTKRTPVSKVQSFDVSRHVTSRRPAAKAGPRLSGAATMWTCFALDCTLPEDSTVPSPEQPHRYRPTGYDSDPEDFTRVCSRKRKMDQNSGNNNNKENNDSLRDLDLQDDAAVYVAVQQFMNTSMTLILHDWSDRPHDTSHAVFAWIERGQILATHTITPKLVWKRMTDANKNTSSHGLAGSATTTKQSELTNSLDLLDVHRILAVKQLDRDRHPFARRQHCFVIKTMSESFLFETQSAEECDRIIRGLKLVVARLATQLVMSDPSMVDEFFLTSPGLASPGEEPKWFADHGLV